MNGIIDIEEPLYILVMILLQQWLKFLSITLLIWKRELVHTMLDIAKEHTCSCSLSSRRSRRLNLTIGMCCQLLSLLGANPFFLFSGSTTLLSKRSRIWHWCWTLGRRRQKHLGASPFFSFSGSMTLLSEASWIQHWCWRLGRWRHKHWCKSPRLQCVHSRRTSSLNQCLSILRLSKALSSWAWWLQ